MVRGVEKAGKLLYRWAVSRAFSEGQNGLEKKISAPAAPRTACSRPEAGRGLSGLRCRGLAACRTAHEDERVVWFVSVYNLAARIGLAIAIF